MFSGVRQVLSGEEAADANVVRKALATERPPKLLNMYGPTETTTFATAYVAQSVPETPSSLPIGRPIANTNAYVLNAQLQLAPTDVTGELYVGGPGVATGYLDRPNLTAQRFIADPFGKQAGATMYRTAEMSGGGSAPNQRQRSIDSSI